MIGIPITETKYMLSVKDAARVLGVSTHTVYRLINKGLLSSKKVSERITCIPAEEILRYLNEK